MADVVTSVGTNSRDYSTYTAWNVDTADTGLYTAGDRAIGEGYDDSDFDETVSLDGGLSPLLASIHMTVAVGQRHLGVAGTGVRLLKTGSGNSIISLEPPATNASAADPRTRLSWIEIDVNDALFNCPINTGVATNGRIPSIENVIVHGMSSTAAGTRAVGDTTRDLRIANSIIYDITAISNNRSIRGIEYEADTASGGVYNCTVHGVRAHGTGVANGIIMVNDDVDNKCRNNIVVATSSSGAGDATSEDFNFPATVVNVVSSNNLSEDATADDGGGSGNLTGQTVADLFVSTTAGMEDFHLKTGSPAINAGVDLGTTPNAFVAIDIDGRDRDAQDDTWDIGADEFVAAGRGAMIGGKLVSSGLLLQGLAQ